MLRANVTRKVDLSGTGKGKWGKERDGKSGQEDRITSQEKREKLVENRQRR